MLSTDDRKFLIALAYAVNHEADDEWGFDNFIEQMKNGERLVDSHYHQLKSFIDTDSNS